MSNVVILEARKEYHKALVEQKVLTITAEGVASNADSGNAPSKAIAKIIAKKLGAKTCSKASGQTA